MGGIVGEPVNSGSWDPYSEHSGLPGGDFQADFQVFLRRADELAAEARSLAEIMRGRLREISPPEGMAADWIDGPDSPVFYLSTAVGYLVACAQGTACWDDFPKSDYRHSPPPQDLWCCDHYPRHCR
jgi:hypothetical protein